MHGRLIVIAALAVACARAQVAEPELIPEGGPPAPVVSAETAAPVPAPAPAAGKAAEAAKTIDVDPVSKVALRGLMWRMANFMAGERVVAAGWGDFRDDIPWSDEDFRRCRTTLERLQMIAAKQSPKEGPDLIPFKVGSALALAPETTDALNPDLARQDAASAASRGILLSGVMVGLSDAQIQALGSSDGVLVADLPADARDAVTRAFRAPLKIVRMKPTTWTDSNGGVNFGWQEDEKGHLDNDLDWSSARVRARLRVSGANLSADSAYAFISGSMGSDAAFTDPDRQSQPWQDRGMDLPIFLTTPNVYKPSDLEGRRFTQPLNLTGVWTLEDVVKRLSTATGLKLKAHRIYAQEPVFIGSPAVTAGELIDALRLAFTASWRRIGDTYLLVWDRMGVGAIQEYIRDATQSLRRATTKRRSDIEKDPRWIQVAMALPFADDDPLALTPDQRSALFSAPASEKIVEMRNVSWEEMTPDQQDYLKKQALQQSIDVPGAAEGQPPVRRPLTDDDVRKLAIGGDCRLELSVQVPGQGWVRSSSGWDVQGINPWQLRRIREQMDPDKAKDSMRGGMPPEMLRMLEHPDPMPLPSDVRAVMVPPLGPARLSELADEMKRHGFTTLLYPALSGGYATFPSQIFPAHPALRGADGLAAAAAAMEPAGIRVVAYLNTLTWQDQDARVHWLSKHPDWVDVDILGRTRLQWLEAHPGGAKASALVGAPLSNFVRASEPMVEARLVAFLKELAGRKEAASIAFAQWDASKGARPGMPRMSLPDLGYAMPDRAAAFQRTGEDPVDLVLWDAYIPDSLRRMGLPTDGGSRPPDKDEPHAALVARLVRQAHEARKDWKVWVLDEASGLDGQPRADAEPAGPQDAGRPDLRITSVFAIGGPRGAKLGGVIFPITSVNLFAAMSEIEDAGEQFEGMPDSVRNAPPMAVFNLFRSEVLKGPNASTPAVVLDFRSAPEQITPSFAFVKAPEPAKPVAEESPVPSTRPASVAAGARRK